MGSIWRPKSYRLLSEKQKADKLIKDKEYEEAVKALYAGTHSGTPEREYAQKQKKVLWDAYVEWSKTDGLYEEVTPANQLAERELELDAALEKVNEIKDALGQPRIQIVESMLAR